MLGMVLMSCKDKYPTTPDFYNFNSAIHEFSFDYNGKKYSLTKDQWSLTDINNQITAITIYDLDVFDGQLFYNPGCPLAFIQPLTGEEIDTSNCSLKYANGFDIDSMEVYTYKSGTFDAKVSNLRQVKARCFCSGGWRSETIKDLTGTFELTIANKKGDQIALTNGSFKIIGDSF
jgi:hypothetical protein